MKRVLKWNGTPIEEEIQDADLNWLDEEEENRTANVPTYTKKTLYVIRIRNIKGKLWSTGTAVSQSD